MAAPVVPGSSDPRKKLLTLVMAASFVFGISICDFTLTKSGLAAFSLFPTFVLVMYFLGRLTIDSNIARIEPCSSFKEQIHLLVHRHVREGVIIDIAFTILFYIFRGAT